MDGILGVLLFIALMTLVTTCCAAVLLLVQCVFVALATGVGCTSSYYVRENRGRVMEMLNEAIKYRLFAVPGVIIFDLLAFTMFADSSWVTAWNEDDWVGWLNVGLLLLASIGLGFLISFWGKTKQLTEAHNRVLAMEAILSCYLCWIAVKCVFLG